MYSRQNIGTAAGITSSCDQFPRCSCSHGILGEEGGVMGNVSSDYLWCLDPLDGTTNFAHSYPGFCVSVGVLRHALPVAGCVIEFTGGPSGWGTRVYSAARNHSATVDGKPLCVSGVKDLSKSLIVSRLKIVT